MNTTRALSFFISLVLILMVQGEYPLAHKSIDSVLSLFNKTRDATGPNPERTSGVGLLDNVISALLKECDTLLTELILYKSNSTEKMNPPLSGTDTTRDMLPVEGRKKNNNGGMMMGAGMISAGTILAISLMGISAVAGKALVTSIIALTLALLSSLKGHEKGTTYEVHAKPIYTQEHTHSSELQHVHHGGYK